MSQSTPSNGTNLPNPTVVYVVQQVVSSIGVLGGLAAVCWLAFAHIIADGETVSLVLVILGVHTAAVVNNKPTNTDSTNSAGSKGIGS